METEFHEGDIIVINPYLKPEHNDYVGYLQLGWGDNLYAAQEIWHKAGAPSSKS
jgi:hypothetical protein